MRVLLSVVIGAAALGAVAIMLNAAEDALQAWDDGADRDAATLTMMALAAAAASIVLVWSTLSVFSCGKLLANGVCESIF